MNKKEKICIRILISVLSVFLLTSIVPALLSASSDLAVCTGVVIIVGIIVCSYLYGEKIINWFTNI